MPLRRDKMLHEITGKKPGLVQWCGPSAVCAMTGVPYMTVLEIFKRVRASRSTAYSRRVIIKGTYNWEVSEVLHRLGYFTRSFPVPEENMTLAAFLRSRPKDQVNDMVLVQITNHYIAVQGRKAADSKTGKPVFIKDMPGRRARVKKLWKIVPRPSQEIIQRNSIGAMITATAQTAVVVKKTKSKEQQYRYQATKAARELGMEICVVEHGYSIEVSAPDGFTFEGLSSREFYGDDRFREAARWLSLGKDYLEAQEAEYA